MNPQNWLKNVKSRHKWLALFTVVWFVILAAAHTPLFDTFGPVWINEEFADSFWPSFISDFGVGLMLAWVLGEVLTRATNRDAGLKMDLHIIQNLNFYKSIRFNVVNNGHEGFRVQEIKWNIYVEAETAHGTDRGMGFPSQVATLFNKNYRHYSDVLFVPLYPGERATAIEITLRWPGGERERPIYFYLSTVEGLFPRTIDLDTEGQVIPETLLKDGSNLAIELPARSAPQ